MQSNVDGQGMADTIPVRCPHCCLVIGGLWSTFERAMATMTEDAALTHAGLTRDRWCCRGMFLAHVVQPAAARQLALPPPPLPTTSVAAAPSSSTPTPTLLTLTTTTTTTMTLVAQTTSSTTTTIVSSLVS